MSASSTLATAAFGEQKFGDFRKRRWELFSVENDSTPRIDNVLPSIRNANENDAVSSTPVRSPHSNVFCVVKLACRPDLLLKIVCDDGDANDQFEDMDDKLEKVADTKASFLSWK